MENGLYFLSHQEKIINKKYNVLQIIQNLKELILNYYGDKLFI